MITAVHFLALPCNSINPSLTNLPLSSSPFQLDFMTHKMSLSFSSNLSQNPIFEVCPSMSTSKNPNRQSIVCMARRYGSETGKIKIKSGRSGGDPEKKKRKRKVPRSRKNKVKMARFVSAAGYVYTMRKGKNMSGKLEIKKYDPNVKQRVVFNESK